MSENKQHNSKRIGSLQRRFDPHGRGAKMRFRCPSSKNIAVGAATLEQWLITLVSKPLLITGCNGRFIHAHYAHGFGILESECRHYGFYAIEEFALYSRRAGRQA